MKTKHLLHLEQKAQTQQVLIWRRWRDSNPRYRKVQLISSQPRYDHFDTSPYFLQLQYLFLVRRDSWRELNDKTHFSNAICLRVAIDFTPGVLSYATWFRIRTLQPLGYISKRPIIIPAVSSKIKSGIRAYFLRTCSISSPTCLQTPS